jgi:antitoxin MazE
MPALERHLNNAKQNIKQWGNSLGLRLPATISKTVELQVDQCVTIATKDNSIIMTPCKPKPHSLEDRLARFDSSKHSGEVMTNDQQLGAEKCRKWLRAGFQIERHHLD